MSGFWSPKVSNLSNAKNSVAGLLQTMRRVPFVIEDTFTFGNYPLEIIAGTLTITNSACRVFHARYLKIWKFLWISFNVKVVVAGGASFKIMLSLPSGCVGPIGIAQRASCYAFDPGTATTGGVALLNAGEGRMEIYKDDASAWTAASMSISGNIFFEVA